MGPTFPILISRFSVTRRAAAAAAAEIAYSWSLMNPNYLRADVLSLDLTRVYSDREGPGQSQGESVAAA